MDCRAQNLLTEWEEREFDRVWSAATEDWVRVDWMKCLSRYENVDSDRKITRVFRYGPDLFAWTIQVD